MKKEISIGNVKIGGTNQVSVQSMCNTKTSDPAATLAQIDRLHRGGCEIIRVALPDIESEEGFREIVRESPLPVVADIHFSHKLAISAIEAGAHAIRINPGNIGDDSRVLKVLDAAGSAHIPVRIGVNMGSIEKKYWSYEGSRPSIMVKSVMDKVRFFEEHGFYDIKISLKSSDVSETVEAYRLIDKECDYPLHLGVTETGTEYAGLVKSAVGIGTLLMEGIGNTVRVSLTADPVKEIKAAKEILKACGLRKEGVEIVSCPTCSRTSVDLIRYAQEAEALFAELDIKPYVKVAVMGCEVNGPGEARDADAGIAFSKSQAFLFMKGKMIRKVTPEKSIEALKDMVLNITENKI